MKWFANTNANANSNMEALRTCPYENNDSGDNFYLYSDIQCMKKMTSQTKEVFFGHKKTILESNMWFVSRRFFKATVTVEQSTDVASHVVLSNIWMKKLKKSTKLLGKSVNRHKPLNCYVVCCTLCVGLPDTHAHAQAQPLKLFSLLLSNCRWLQIISGFWIFFFF